MTLTAYMNNVHAPINVGDKPVRVKFTKMMQWEWIEAQVAGKWRPLLLVNRFGKQYLVRVA